MQFTVLVVIGPIGLLSSSILIYSVFHPKAYGRFDF